MKMGFLGWTLIQSGGYLYKKRRFRHTETSEMNMQKKGSNHKATVSAVDYGRPSKEPYTELAMKQREEGVQGAEA